MKKIRTYVSFVEIWKCLGAARTTKITESTITYKKSIQLLKLKKLLKSAKPKHVFLESFEFIQIF